MRNLYFFPTDSKVSKGAQTCRIAHSVDFFILK